MLRARILTVAMSTGYPQVLLIEFCCRYQRGDPPVGVGSLAGTAIHVMQAGTAMIQVLVVAPVHPALFETLAVAMYVPPPCPGVQLKGQEVPPAARV